MQSFSGLHRYIMERGCKFVMEREKSMKKTIGSTLLLLLLFSNEMTLFFVCNSKKAFASGGNQSEAETWEPADDMPHLSTPDEMILRKTKLLILLSELWLINSDTRICILMTVKSNAVST